MSAGVVFENQKLTQEAAIFFIPRSSTDFTDAQFLRSIMFKYGINYSRNSSKLYQNVMRYAPNNYGLFDTIGNASEWCSDEWNENAPLLLANGLKPKFVDGTVKGVQIEPPRVVKGGGLVHAENSTNHSSTIHIGERKYATATRGIAGFRLAMDINVETIAAASPKSRQ